MSISWNASLPIRADGHVAGDRDHRDRVEHRGADAGHEVRRARPGGAHAHADLARHAGVAVGGVGAALLVADEDVAELRVVAEDVVEGQDHPARVAEHDVDALAEQRLADDVGADPGPLAVGAPRGASSRACSTAPRPGRPSPARGCAARAVGAASPLAPAGVAGSRPFVIVIASGPPCDAWPVSARTSKDPRLPARVPSVFGGSSPSGSFLRVPPFSRREPVMRPRRPRARPGASG